MKREIDKSGRIIYKSSSSVSRGGNAYIHRTVSGKVIKNREGLRNALEAISKKYGLIDTTIKVYNDIFFLFFHIPISLASAELIESIGKNIPSFAEWDENYVFTGVYDLQERFLRKDIERWGYDYNEGYKENA